MTKHDMLKMQTCVLRVNLHCEGCMHKVKKKLQKVEGVYKVSIDSEQGKVIVSGNADPASLIEKLEKAGKHAELWGGPQKPAPVFISGDQFKKFQQMGSFNKNAGKKGNHEHKNGFLPEKGGFKDEKPFPATSVSFHLPRDEVFDDEDDDEFDDDEDFDDEFDDESEEEAPHKPPAKAAGHKQSKAKKGGGCGGIDVFFKGMLKKAGGGRKKGDSGEKSKKGEKIKEDGGKKGGFEFGDLKKGKNEIKKGGESFDGGKQQHRGFNEMKANHGGAGAGGGRNMDMMVQKGGFPGGGFMGNNPYSQQQQQYMAHMMMMNQLRENGQGAYHPSGFARLPPVMTYGPPPGMVYGPPPEPYTHMFSDENTGSCSIM